MLNPEVAQARLKEVYLPDWRSRCIKQINHLPQSLQRIGFGLFGYDALGQRSSQVNFYQVQEQSLQQLEPLSPDDRTRIFSAIFPRFAPIVESAWQLLARSPYQSGYSRRSFRSPHHLELSFAKRSSWLQELIGVVEGYDQDLEWFAAWVPYLSYNAPNPFGILFAAAINQSDSLGQTIFQILTASATGNDEIGAMGRHVTRALLMSDRVDGWEFVERLLIAAQRQEGLRQTILETVDEAHPISFQRMLRLIVTENLTRFSATIRAVDVWLGFGLESLNEKLAKLILSQTLELFENAEAQRSALASDDPQTVYLALWTTGFVDAMQAIPLAEMLLDHAQATHRFVAVHFLAQLEITPARLAILPALSDRDLHVSTRAVQALTYTGDIAIQQSDAFERLEQALPNFPAKARSLPSIVWDWIILEPSQEAVAAALIQNLGTRSPKRLIPYLALLDSYKRANVAKLLAEIMPWDAEIRDTLLSLVGDASAIVREAVIRLLHTCSITADESILLERLLTRKASDLRRGILGLFLNQSDEATIATAQRLLHTKQAPQRQAGLELLRELVQQNRSVRQCRSDAADYQTSRSQLTITETQLLNSILQSATEPTLTDALGLVQIADLTPIATPQAFTSPITFMTPAAINCLLALDSLIHDHRQTPIVIDQQEELLGNLTWQFPHFDLRLSQDENRSRLPLNDVWENWWRDRRNAFRDDDGLELIRALMPRFEPRGAAFAVDDELNESSELTLGTQTQLAIQSLFLEQPTLQYPHQIQKIISWLLYLNPPSPVSNFLLDATATLINLIPIEELSQDPQWLEYDHWGTRSQLSDFMRGWLNFVRSYQYLRDDDPVYYIRWWHLLRWVDRFLPSYGESITLEDTFNAHQAEGATEADLIFQLVGVQEGNRPHNFHFSLGVAEAKTNLRSSFHELSQLTRRKFAENQTPQPMLLELGDRVRQRVLAVELQRGDLPTAASHAARSLRSITGIPTIVQLLQALDRDKLVRHYAYNSLSKASVFSHLMRVSFPNPDDTPEEFAQRIQSAQISLDRLIQFAFYAPQWVNYIEHTIGWNGFAEAVWWFHAHTKDNEWAVEQDVRETWIAQISERTPLSARTLCDGAVDVAWFHRIYKLLKADRWQQLYEAAQYASSGAGHQRAKLFSDAMLGNLERTSLGDRITQKRHQDSVRALGLLPLAKGKKRDRDILDRYQILQEFLRTSKKFGSQRQASEKLAVSIGLENLARTAGYEDPLRLQWAMEAQAIADLADRAQVVTVDQVSVSLAINPHGEPEITIAKQGKPLKAIPAKLKKDPQIQALTLRKQEIIKQASRMRISLEQAMCRGDRFTALELIQLAKHPVLSPMLSQLILMGDREIGYLINQGTALQNHSSVIESIRSSEFRIAHPYDLLISQEWHLWQQNCFDSSRTQPFKQVFRELYVPTSAEQKDTISHRYEGHQVNPRQALALFAQRGWVTAPEEGVRRTFHQEGLIAEVDFLNGFYTPLEVEGLTIAGVTFYHRDDWKRLPISDIPPCLFSEVMRDLDLVVSVAHQGGVDPEATASTVEMRSSLIRETCRLLKLTNVQVQSAHALIEGELGSYSVHLGSAIVHRQPGGALCIVPVHSQHRGRIFLPFVDPDPKTAEVVSKVLLLARDKAIQDPTILEQIL